MAKGDWDLPNDRNRVRKAMATNFNNSEFQIVVRICRHLNNKAKEMAVNAKSSTAK